MARPQMWFGVRGHMDWVRCPRVDMDLSGVGWSTNSQYLNGGAGARGSKSSHKVYDMSWSGLGRDEARKITDIADGIFDTQEGINLVYFLEPTTMDKNVLPQLWASPFQQGVEGLTLFQGQNPSIVQTPVNTYGYPARSVQYTANTPSSSLYTPIPPGYTAWVGVHGASTGTAGMTVATTLGTTSATPVTLTTLPVTTATRFSNSFDASATVDGIILGLVNNGPASSDTFTWSGTMVQVLPTGQTPQDGNFISGQGHSGCQFSEHPSQSVQFLGRKSVDDGQVSVAANLIETGSWL
jgi:hypothetical protein